MPADNDQSAKLVKSLSPEGRPVYETPEPEEVPRHEARLIAFYMGYERVWHLRPRRRLPLARMSIADHRCEAGALDVTQRLLARQCSVRSLLRAIEERVVLPSELDVHNHRAVRRGAQLVYPLVQRGADQPLAGLP